MSKIKEFYQVRIEPQLQNRQKENQVFTHISKLVSQLHKNNIDKSDESYCFKFQLPMLGVNNLYTILDISPIELKVVFEKDWGSLGTHMHKDPYYQLLLLLLLHSIYQNKESLSKSITFLILVKVWNGRKSHFLKFCDPKIMKYVVSTLSTKRHKVSKHETPAALLSDHFVPTMLSKYVPEIKRDTLKLKRFFEQCYARIFQLFIFNPRLNPVTNQKEASGGLLPLYMKAKKEGLHVSAQQSKSAEDSTYSDYITTSNREEIINKTADFMVLNDKISYPQNLINNINTKTHVSTKVIDQILEAINDQNNYDIIQNVLVLFLSRTQVSVIDDICAPSFAQKVQKNIISSKNNPEMQKLNKLLDLLLLKIFNNSVKANFHAYSNVHKMKIRNVIIMAMEHVLFRVNCRGN